MPPVVAENRVVDAPAQTASEPAILAGAGDTVTTLVAEQPGMV